MTRDAHLRRALQLSVLSILLSGALGGVAVVVGLTTNSLSLLGFGFDAAIDSVASIALVWRFLVEASQPHRAQQVEKIAEAVVGVVLLVLAAYLAINAVGALADQGHPQPTVLGTVLLIISVAALPFLAVAKLRVAKRLDSGALRADGLLTAIAASLALISLTGLGLTEAFGFFWADAVGALVVAAILVREGISSVRAIGVENPLTG
jgi:divalent metal cation (Fe/Co/Zn/Cd) transporter